MSECEIKVWELEQRLTEVEAQQAVVNLQVEEIQELVRLLKRQQIKQGPLAPLAKVLAYHHEMVNGWARLASEGGDYDKLYVEFVRMQEVVTHYENVAQRLLGISPSPLADLEEN